jgi:hypothetical protein
MNKYSFNSVHTHIEMIDGKRVEVTEAVTIRNGKGYKTVITRENGKTKQSKHPLTQQEVSNIKERKFMPTLFDQCYMGLGECSANSARLNRKQTRQKKALMKKGTKKNKRNA